MDYSLLVGIEKNMDSMEDMDSDEWDDMLDDDTLLFDESDGSEKFIYENGARIMHFSIIDYL